MLCLCLCAKHDPIAAVVSEARVYVCAKAREESMVMSEGYLFMTCGMEPALYGWRQ